jgi:hypothetical protein
MVHANEVTSFYQTCKDYQQRISLLRSQVHAFANRNASLATRRCAELRLLVREYNAYIEAHNG